MGGLGPVSGLGLELGYLAVIVGVKAQRNLLLLLLLGRAELVNKLTVDGTPLPMPSPSSRWSGVEARVGVGEVGGLVMGVNERSAFERESGREWVLGQNVPLSVESALPCIVMLRVGHLVLSLRCGHRLPAAVVVLERESEWDGEGASSLARHSGIASISAILILISTYPPDIPDPTAT